MGAVTGIVPEKRLTWLRLLSVHVVVTVSSARPGSCFQTSGLAHCYRQARRGHTRHITMHAKQAERARQADKAGEAGEASKKGKGKHGKPGRQSEQGRQTSQSVSHLGVEAQAPRFDPGVVSHLASGLFAAWPHYCICRVSISRRYRGVAFAPNTPER